MKGVCPLLTYNARMARKATITTLLAGGRDDLPVEVERKRVRRLNLRVRADGSAHLSIPARCPLAEAQRFLDAHVSWLERQLARRDTAASSEKDGGLVPLWGKIVALPDGISAEELWRSELTARLPEVAARMEAALGVRADGWQLRVMKTRWGSCTPRTRRIRINVRLAAYPPTCLDYVVAHELCHLLEPSHNARFHELLATAYPSEREARALLRQAAHELAAVDSPPTVNVVETISG